MKNPVIAIGLDAADPVLMEKWMAQGHLKNLSKIRQQGAYGRLKNTLDYAGGSAEFSSTEPLWVMFTTGCYPNKTGFWDTVKFSPTDYKVTCDKIYSGYDYQDYQPFYALGDRYRVATFDIPVTRLSNQVNGLQILGWGGHFPFVPSGSQPAEALPNLIQKYGKNPVLHNDDGKWWDAKYETWLQKAVSHSVTTRADICRDLLKEEPWDLFLTVFGDTHSLGHDLYDQSQPDHPLYSFRTKNGTTPDPLLESFKVVDESIGRILEQAPENAYIFCFAVHGMAANHTDLLSMFHIAEVLYRFNFPGKVALAPGKIGTTPPPPITRPIRKGWSGEAWRTNYEPNPLKKLLNTWAPKRFIPRYQNGLTAPHELAKQGVDLSWASAMSYSPLWPQMKAFALPGFADGHIRINLKGRERDGIVPASEYDALCEELAQIFHRLRDGRTGKPLVKQVVRTRQSGSDDDAKLPDADLVVVWHEIPTDVVDSPDFGRIGPVTFNRPGGHRPHGFVMAKGPGIEAGSEIVDGQVVDLAPTMLQLLNAPIPDFYDGKSLLDISTAAVS